MDGSVLYRLCVLSVWLNMTEPMQGNEEGTEIKSAGERARCGKTERTEHELWRTVWLTGWTHTEKKTRQLWASEIRKPDRDGGHVFITYRHPEWAWGEGCRKGGDQREQFGCIQWDGRRGCGCSVGGLRFEWQLETILRWTHSTSCC